MFEKIKDSLSEIIEIADKCPERYQVKCFEILLDSLVRGQAGASAAAAAIPSGVAGSQAKPEPSFFAAHGISKDLWARVFNHDVSSNSYDIIVSDLKEKPKSKKQVRLALILGIKNLLETGTPSVPKDALIELCESHAAYDAGNFSAYMKKPYCRSWFILKGDAWTLTHPGQDKAAEVIKEVAQ
jgi:hypothetical protein